MFLMEERKDWWRTFLGGRCRMDVVDMEKKEGADLRTGLFWP